MEDLKQEAYFIPVNNTDKLHLKRIYKENNGEVVFMLHGSIENGKMFYSSSGKGFAPFLARHGYDVYIADTRGRGQSIPPINRDSKFGQTETITEDIPAFINKIIEIRGNTKQHWVAHSWGGVLLASYFSRFSEHRNLVKSMVFFGTKRIISVFNWEKFLKINIFWNIVFKILIKKNGYLPAKDSIFGSDNETKKSFQQTEVWFKGNPWIDPQDGFNYTENIKKIDLPPMLSITGINDKSLGHPIDVLAFVKECGKSENDFKIIGKNTGFKHDYDHINLLIHPDAVNDHFLYILEWMQKI